MFAFKKINSLIGKNVILIDTDGEIFEGRIIDYEKPADNEEEEFAVYFITVTEERWYFLEHEISSIELKL